MIQSSPAREAFIGLSETMKVPISIADPKLEDCQLIHINHHFEDLTGYG